MHRTLIWPGIQFNNIRFYNHIDENFTSYYCLRVVWWFTRKFMPCFWLCVPIRNAPNGELWFDRVFSLIISGSIIKLTRILRPIIVWRCGLISVIFLMRLISLIYRDIGNYWFLMYTYIEKNHVFYAINYIFGIHLYLLPSILVTKEMK